MALHEKPVDRNVRLVYLGSGGESGVRVQMPAATNTCSQEMQTLPRYRQTERTRSDDAFGATSKRIELSFARSWRPGPTVPCAGLPAPPRTGIIDMSSAPPRPKRGEEHSAQADGMLFSWCCLRCCAMHHQTAPPVADRPGFHHPPTQPWQRCFASLPPSTNIN